MRWEDGEGPEEWRYDSPDEGDRDGWREKSNWDDAAGHWWREDSSYWDDADGRGWREDRREDGERQQDWSDAWWDDGDDWNWWSKGKGKNFPSSLPELGKARKGAWGIGNALPHRGEWVPDEEILIGMLPFTPKKDLPPDKWLWPSIVTEIKELGCEIFLKSMSQDRKRKKFGLPPISRSKVIIKGSMCADAWDTLLQRVHDYAGFPAVWRDYPEPVVGMKKGFEVGDGCCFSMLLCRTRNSR